MTVCFSTRAPNADYLGFEASPEAIIAAAKKAEEVDFDAIFVNDHVIVGDDTRLAPWTNVYDTFVSMSFIAAHTSRIGDVSGPAIRLPQQKPALSCRGPMVRIHLPPGMSLRTSGPRGPTTPRPITLHLLPASPTGGPKVRIRVSPAESLRTIGSSDAESIRGRCAVR
jgi:hypothetical protein